MRITKKTRPDAVCTWTPAAITIGTHQSPLTGMKFLSKLKKAHNELESSGIRASIFVLIRAFITIMCVFVNRACDKGNNSLFKLTVSSAEII